MMSEKTTTSKQGQSPASPIVLEEGGAYTPGLWYTGSATRGKAGAKLPQNMRAPSAEVAPLCENPKRAGCKAFDRFALYGAVGHVQTVEAALKANLERVDFAWDFARGHIAARAPKTS